MKSWCRVRGMKCRAFVALAFWLATLATDSASADLADVLQRIRPSVVGVGTVLPTRRPPTKFSATGFAVADGRYVVTNAHALPKKLNHRKKERLAVFVGRGKGGKAVAVEVVGRDDVHDLALLRFKSGRLPPLAVGNSAKVREGELYAFTGYPIGTVLGLYPATHQGIISAITPIAIPQLSSRSLDSKIVKKLRNPYDVFQLDATAYPGNSGSPVYDPKSGVVIGVINKVFVKESRENILAKPSGITFAIPARYVKELLKKHGVSN